MRGIGTTTIETDEMTDETTGVTTGDETIVTGEMGGATPHHHLEGM